MPSSSATVVSKCTVYPSQKSTIKSLKLSVSDLPMLSCHYIQKGVLFTSPPPHHFIDDLVDSLKHSLSLTLAHFPALAGCFETDSDGYVHIVCNDAGVDFIHAKAKHLTLDAALPPNSDVPHCFKEFFAYDRTISYKGHNQPLAAVQVTELDDGVFIGCTVNHSVTDGTSFWHFFNTFAEINRGVKKITKSPDFSRDTVFNSAALIRVPDGGPKITFSGNEPLRERIFHFTRESILTLKHRANSTARNGFSDTSAEIFGKEINDDHNKTRAEISSFQSLSAQLWRSVTRVRNLDTSKATTFRMAVNCRHRLEPKMDSHYFGNAIQSIPTVASVGELLSHDLRWGADLLHKNVVAHDSDPVRRGVEDWESTPRLFPLGNFDGASMTMGSSPRFPMYNNDFGWGRPLAVRSGRANKFDGKISAFPGREGNGSVDLEVVLAPETMAGLEADMEFMQYVSAEFVPTTMNNFNFNYNHNPDLDLDLRFPSSLPPSPQLPSTTQQTQDVVVSASALASSSSSTYLEANVPHRMKKKRSKQTRPDVGGSSSSSRRPKPAKKPDPTAPKIMLKIFRIWLYHDCHDYSMVVI